MPVYKDDQRGTWFASYTYKEKETGKYKRVKKRGFKTQKEAKDWEVLSKASLHTQKDDELGGVTFREMAERWENNLESSPESIAHHLNHFELRFADYFDKPIKDITRADLVEWKSKLSKMNYATRTKNTTLSYVRGVFRFASEMYDIPNTASFLKNFKKTDEENLREMQVWLPEEFYQFLEAEPNPVYKTFFEFLYWTGCRRGEAVGLQKRCVRPDMTVDIRYSQRLRTRGLKPTKTKNCRIIRIDENLYNKLLPYLDGEDGYVFGDPIGLNTSSIQQHFDKAVEVSGVKRIRLHDLRHSHASWLINHGVNIVAVSKRLGHSSIKETLKTYTHLLESTDNHMMEVINTYKKGQE